MNSELKHEIKSDEPATSQPPISRPDVIKAAGLAGAATLFTTAASEVAGEPAAAMPKIPGPRVGVHR
jgi:hypothetical protein